MVTLSSSTHIPGRRIFVVARVALVTRHRQCATVAGIEGRKAYTARAQRGLL